MTLLDEYAKKICSDCMKVLDKEVPGCCTCHGLGKRPVKVRWHGTRHGFPVELEGTYITPGPVPAVLPVWRNLRASRPVLDVEGLQAIKACAVPVIVLQQAIPERQLPTPHRALPAAPPRIYLGQVRHTELQMRGNHPAVWLQFFWLRDNQTGTWHTRFYSRRTWTLGWTDTILVANQPWKMVGGDGTEYADPQFHLLQKEIPKELAKSKLPFARKAK